MNGTAHIGNGIIIENSYVAIKDDKIELVADARTMRIDITKFDTVINIEQKSVSAGYP